VVWAVFWLSFFILESLAWRTPALITLSWAGVGVLFVILALLPWRKERAGGVLLASAGLLGGAAYVIWAPRGLPLASRVITTLVLGGPPIVAGILFLRHHRTVADGMRPAHS
jgi:hypothetical protein